MDSCRGRYYGGYYGEQDGIDPKTGKFLAVIKDFIASNGYSPSYEELKQMNGMKSKSNVHAYVYALKKRGYLDIIRHSKRSIVVL